MVVSACTRLRWNSRGFSTAGGCPRVCYGCVAIRRQCGGVRSRLLLVCGCRKPCTSCQLSGRATNTILPLKFHNTDDDGCDDDYRTVHRGTHAPHTHRQWVRLVVTYNSRESLPSPLYNDVRAISLCRRPPTGSGGDDSSAAAARRYIVL